MAKTKIPKWVNPRREDYLAQLVNLHANKCLMGHIDCPIESHYKHIVWSKPKMTLTNPSFNMSAIPDSQYLKPTNYQRQFVVGYQVKPTAYGKTELICLAELLEREAIKAWIYEDRLNAQADWQAEYEARHKLNTQRFKPLYGKFSAVARDVWHDSQPLFYIEAIGVSGLTYKPFAQVRIASTQTKLYVNISQAIKPLSKHKRKKMLRYGKSAHEAESAIYTACGKAVFEHLNTR